MEWTDSGFILATRRHGETSLIVEAFTPAHGRHLGLVKGGRSARLRAVLQPGNRARLTWRARLSEHLGHFTVEAEGSRAADIMLDSMALAGLNTLTALVRLLPERDPHDQLYALFEQIAAALLDAFALTGFFLDRDIYGPRAISAPQSRERLLRLLREAGGGAAP